MDPSLATIYGAIIGAVLAGPVSYYYSKRLVEQTNKHNIETIRITEFNNAAAKFRAAFVDDMYAIRQAISTPISDDQGFFLMSKIHKGAVTVETLERAKIMFEPYLTTDELKGFNAAWKNYIEWQQHIQDDTSNIEVTFAMLRYLENLLKYADRK
jgi:hypothetical protein